MQALACFNVSFACVSKWVREEEGPECSSVPKTPHPLEVCVVFVALEMRNEWYISPTPSC